MEFVTNFYFFSQIFWHWRTDVCLNLRLHTYLRGDLSWRIKNIPPREGARSHPVQRRNGLPCTPKTEKKLPGTLLQQNPNRPEFPVSRKLPGLPGARSHPVQRRNGLPCTPKTEKKLPGTLLQQNPNRPEFPVSRKLPGLPGQDPGKRKLPGLPEQLPEKRKLPGLPEQPPVSRKLLTACPAHPTGSAQKANIRKGNMFPERPTGISRKLPGLPEQPPVSRKLLTACPAHPTGSAQKANIRKGNMFPERPTGISAGNLLYSRQPEFFFFSGLLFFCPWPFYIWNLFSTSIWDFR